MAHKVSFCQLNFVVQDMAATIDFYHRLGLEFEAEPDTFHLAVDLPNGQYLEFDTADFGPQWNSGWRGGFGGPVVIGFSVPTREAVDETYHDLTAAGAKGQQPPYDPFWGARYAIVEDPDGNAIGLMSPIDPDRRFWPPQPPPSV